jgi:hypothetical protein
MSSTSPNSTPPIVRVDYDDAPNDVVDKINAVLAAYGLQLSDDGQVHNGFILYSLVNSAPAVDNDVARRSTK